MEDTALDPTDPLAGLNIIDCDAHFTEPPDVWTSRVPAAKRDHVPAQRTVDGITAWYLNDDLWSGVGGNTIGNGHKKVKGTHVIHPFTEIDPAAWDPAARLDLLDTMGIYAQILYPNGVGFASNHIFAIEDVDQRTLVLQTYNDFLVDIQAESKDRLFPQAMLPVWDMDLTITEMHRMADKGIRGFTLADRPEMIGLPQLPKPYFAPMWAAADEMGTVMNFHVAAGMKKELPRKEQLEKLRRPVDGNAQFKEMYWDDFGPQRRLAVLASQMITSNMRVIVNFCASDMFDRYPNLKIVSAESGIGWVPFILEALEFQLDDMVTNSDEVGFTKRRPTEYFRDHFYVMFWFEQVAPRKLLEDVGVNNVLVETDIPHPTCLYPGAREHFAKVLADIDHKTKSRVLQDNAAELYKIPLPATRT